ncbi:hypothetical protein M431DRAFT_322491 [Trichoderma harzianum CBS 226.95]|uniref:Uncharacterized protein n=1 Tax=Trichoderma harzianum CBS 226.95 TaxID=983964 RepID=A0A2T3ZVP8_TRIHA|nr:hypothetical protein M431DRAFT_322491 [Trichoderma harzianum CBS 226.95]PTB48895.1 hypothetical protein M431DRAFT_322491 [Trichoderma harzianum CBS 226.95]
MILSLVPVCAAAAFGLCVSKVFFYCFTFSILSPISLDKLWRESTSFDATNHTETMSTEADGRTDGWIGRGQHGKQGEKTREKKKELNKVVDNGQHKGGSIFCRLERCNVGGSR